MVTGSAPPLDPDRVKAALTEPSRWALHYVERTGSTNDDARSAAGEGAVDGTVFLAGFQTVGRGSRGRIWQSPPGGSLLMSAILRPESTLAAAALTSLGVLALVEGLRFATGLKTQIKWPNDAVIRDRKVGGVLVELMTGAVVVGIGANLNFPADAIHEPDYPATTVQDELGRACDREAVTAAVLNALGGFCADLRADDTALNARWHELSSILNREVVVDTESDSYSGMVTGFGDGGRLLLREADGTERAILVGRVRLEMTQPG